MGKGKRHKMQRQASRAMIESHPLTVLHHTLIKRGWVYEDLSDDPDAFKTSVPYEPTWKFPPSLMDGDEAEHVDEIYPAMVCGSFDGIEATYAGREENACARHQSPSPQRFSTTSAGITDLATCLSSLEAHVMNGAELLQCADGPGGCCDPKDAG
jgi:hypothetical protein